MRLTIEHHTHYQYSEQVARSTQYLRLTPRPSVRQHIVRWDLDMPEAAAQTTDAFGNILHVLTLDKPHDEIRIRAHGVVEINPDQPVASGNGLSPLVYQRFTRFTRPDQALLDFATGFERPRSSEDLAALSAAIIERIPYTAGETDATSTAAQAFSGGKGVCQDHTHVLLSVCRQLGLPARYVSGYLYTEDSSHVASHAWAEVWMNDHWLKFNEAKTEFLLLGKSSALDKMEFVPTVDFGGVEISPMDCTGKAGKSINRARKCRI